MGDAACLVRIRFTRWWHCHRLLGIDRWCHWHDIRVHVTGRDGFDVGYMDFSRGMIAR